MALTLTTFGATDVIDHTVLRARLQSVETYLNEEIANSDRSAGWLHANHVYRPDFFGPNSANPRTVFTTGETQFRQRPLADDHRAFFSFYLGDGPYLVPGLAATFQIPESLQQGTYYYRINTDASWYCYEYGGGDNTYLDEETSLTATFHLACSASKSAIRAETQRSIYKGSLTDASEIVPLFPRKQYSLCYPFIGNTKGISTPGCVSVGVYVKPVNPAGSGLALTTWRHIIVQQGNFIARARWR